MAPTVMNDPKLQLKGHTYWVRCATWSPDGSLLATGCADKSLRVFNAEGAEVYKVAHPDWVWCVAFSYTTKKKRIASGGLDGCVRLMEAETGREILQMKDHSSTVNAVTFNADGSKVLSGSYDKTAKLYAVSNGKTLLTLDGQNTPVLSVAFTAAEDIITGTARGEVRVSDLTGKTLQLLQAHDGPLLSLSVSADGGMLASGGGDKIAHVWKIGEGGQLSKQQTLKHAEQVNCTMFSPDSLLLSTAAADGHVRVYEAGREWDELARLKGHSDEANSVSLACKGARVLLASASDDKTAAVWDLSSVAVALRVAQARAAKGGGGGGGAVPK
eukprot:CAMPEP_0181330544 /NCGR_PEP_ID=MMETSP1101-20121128/23960_1 /TAXON_ID=46948 /ORGANISM="Rhodomonas abbreviata, Strain Caron Lab Isolate" /LENGTH=328 /DNA_ID=CAMNT_0023439815 /DNA_START=235 /DNA_END=1221 /DNA_ORIENTATION=+